MVRAAIAVQPAERHVHETRTDGQGAALLLHCGIGAGGINVALPGARAIGEAERVQHVMLAA